jgi:hypothetical protein
MGRVAVEVLVTAPTAGTAARPVRPRDATGGAAELSSEARVRLAIVITNALIAVRDQCRRDGLPLPSWAAELAALHDRLLSNAAGVTPEERTRALTRERVRRHRARRRAAAA